MVLAVEAVRYERRVNGGLLTRLPERDSRILPEIDEAKVISGLLREKFLCDDQADEAARLLAQEKE